MSALAAAPIEDAAEAARGYVVDACSDIAEVDAREWDALLAPDDFSATHRFVHVCQRSRVAEAEYRHVVVRERRRLLASANFCRMPVDLGLLAPGGVRVAIAAARRLRRGFLRMPVAFCGLPVSIGRSSLRVRAGADARAIVPLVARELERWAAVSRTPVLCFKELSSPELPVADLLTDRGYLKLPSLPSCALDIPWGTFEEYLGAMRAGYRRQVLATLRGRDALGLRVRLVRDWEAEAERIFPLYEQVMDRAPFQLERLELAFFRHLAEDLREETSALLVERDGALLAAAVLLEARDTLVFLFAGIDYASHRPSQAYLTLVTEIVAEAIRRRASRLELGQTTYDLKQRLGATPSPRWLYLRCANPAAQLSLRVASRALFPTISPPPRRVFKTD